ncbi:hypothetical protein BLA24_20740 [Streptomyces cinnamoneus]|uniref:HEAT repeat domain-containing protein n=1 Tax=Streptomyces cinnamoneus TaxID=53446 RepID=A0A2G1XFN0_STRCJ|nr:hypothetical protein [Streptomyces cinnamoneus]PHQ50038.1 hypothetical protein BLA24_20740 [Streptomyces cinnamoneus]PPT13184.1 hypothetical protein CYQ11_10040 [Streptomyces cinnamoneus]
MARIDTLLGVDFDGRAVDDPYDVVDEGLDDPRHRERVPGLVALMHDSAASDHDRLTACIALLTWGEAAGHEAVVAGAADPKKAAWYDSCIDRKFSVDNTFGHIARAMASYGSSGMCEEKGTQAGRVEAVRALIRIADTEYFDEQLEWAVASCAEEPGVVDDVEDVIQRGVLRLSGDTRVIGFDLATQLVDLACAVSDADPRRAMRLAAEVLFVAPSDRALKHAEAIASRADGPDEELFAGHLRSVGAALHSFVKIRQNASAARTPTATDRTATA